VSPEINVADLTGKLPADPLMVYDKLAEPVGPLAAGLVDALWRRFREGSSGKLDRVDLSAALPAAVHARMEAPIRAARHTMTLPLFDATQLDRFRAC
jgi:hypothetical protein